MASLLQSLYVSDHVVHLLAGDAGHRSHLPFALNDGVFDVGVGQSSDRLQFDLHHLGDGWITLPIRTMARFTRLLVCGLTLSRGGPGGAYRKCDNNGNPCEQLHASENSASSLLKLPFSV